MISMPVRVRLAYRKSSPPMAPPWTPKACGMDGPVMSASSTAA